MLSFNSLDGFIYSSSLWHGLVPPSQLIHVRYLCMNDQNDNVLYVVHVHVCRSVFFVRVAPVSDHISHVTFSDQSAIIAGYTTVHFEERERRHECVVWR